MIRFTLNGDETVYVESPDISLLDYLRNHAGITSVKDGCSGEGVCGACTVEINGVPQLACRKTLKDINGKQVVTTEGLEQPVRETLARAFSVKGAVQCGFCSPGMMMRSAHLVRKGEKVTRDKISSVLRPNICRCTGYVKIIDAVEQAIGEVQAGKKLSGAVASGGIGTPLPKYESVETALGLRPFVYDMRTDNMLWGVLCFSEYPRAVLRKIDTSAAEKSEGVVRVFTAQDIPGEKKTGLIFDDWPIMIDEGETTHTVADVVALVVAESEELARKAASKVRVEYEPLDPVTDMMKALDPASPQVHSDRPNLLETSSVGFGDVEKAFAEAAFTYSDTFTTQRIEHAFLETEAALAIPEEEKIKLYSQGQGVYVDRKQIARLLALPEENIEITQVSNGGGFGGKEDLTVQGHAALAARLTGRPVMVHLSRPESIRMHPKRHPVRMEIAMACNKKGKLTAVKLRAWGDTGAYASVGTKVMERVVGHATGAYTVPNVDIAAYTVYTNNPPSGAMRGFGVPQVTFAVERCIDELCKMGGFDRWQFRYDNALDEGSRTATGQRLQGVGLKKTLLAVKKEFENAAYAGLACGIKNTGVGNGMTDESRVILEVTEQGRIRIHHGWSEMGQGVHNMAIQTLCEETGIEPDRVESIVNTKAGLNTGMTTSSRATALVGNAVRDAAARLKTDLSRKPLEELAGEKYTGEFICNWTSKPGEGGDDPKIHFSYGYATQLVILNDQGAITKVVAAHDAGRVMNPMLFEGQIQGAVHMGLGYALSEDLPVSGGVPEHFRLGKLGILRAHQMPEVKVIAVEESDPVGPYGAKGIGEIGLVPTAAAVANAFCYYDGELRNELPLRG